VADFLAPQARLIVEVDGLCHRRRASADARRDAKLARLGYRVLRLDAALVMQQLPVAVQLIRQALCQER
jgi:very-short-patch-repair endonuclease